MPVPFSTAKESDIILFFLFLLHCFIFLSIFYVLNLKHFLQMQWSQYLSSTHMVGLVWRLNLWFSFKVLQVEREDFTSVCTNSSSSNTSSKSCLDGSQRKLWTTGKGYLWITWLAGPEKGRGCVFVWGALGGAFEVSTGCSSHPLLLRRQAHPLRTWSGL